MRAALSPGRGSPGCLPGADRPSSLSDFRSDVPDWSRTDQFWCSYARIAASAELRRLGFRVGTRLHSKSDRLLGDIAVQGLISSRSSLSTRQLCSSAPGACPASGPGTSRPSGCITPPCLTRKRPEGCSLTGLGRLGPLGGRPGQACQGLRLNFSVADCAAYTSLTPSPFHQEQGGVHRYPGLIPAG